MAKGQERLKVFFDASVLVAAAFSSSGGSFRVLNEASIRGFHFVTSKHAFGEAERSVLRKRMERMIELQHLAAFLEIVPDAPSSVIEKLLDVIDFKDAPILAAALQADSQVLLTLDREHFLDNPRLVEEFPLLQVMTPGAFIQNYF
jgi:predicted nucleic acid-binding protein